MFFLWFSHLKAFCFKNKIYSNTFSFFVPFGLIALLLTFLTFLLEIVGGCSLLFATSKLDRTADYHDWQLWSQFPYCRTAFSKWEFSAPSSPILDYYFGYFWMSGCTVMIIWSFSSDFLVWESKEMANLSFNTFLGWRRGTGVQPNVLRSKWFVSFFSFFFFLSFGNIDWGILLDTLNEQCYRVSTGRSSLI